MDRMGKKGEVLVPKDLSLPPSAAFLGTELDGRWSRWAMNNMPIWNASVRGESSAFDTRAPAPGQDTTLHLNGQTRHTSSVLSPLSLSCSSIPFWVLPS